MDDSLHYKLVVVGSSAGGVEALSTLVSTLPEDFPAPIVIAQHLDPNRESHLNEILDRRSTLPVRTVTEHEPLEPGVVFVVPANRHVNITDSEIDLMVDGSEQPKPSVDRLLRSAAGSFGEGIIAVILTGTGSDGAAGASAVKKAGGTVVIQNPETAEYPGMPLSLAPNVVDIVAELDMIGRVLYDLLTDAAELDELEEQEALETLLEYVRERNGIDFSSYKTPTILRRLQRRMVATRSEDIEGYTRYLQDYPEEHQQLTSSFLINVTDFFRDTELFEYLENEVIPSLIEGAHDQGNQIRLWSAGCSTGEEAYSLALLVAEALGDEMGQFNVRIFATDVDDEAINFARHGIYSRSALEDVPEDLINRYFVAENGEYQVNKLIRSMIVFGEHDLARRAPFPRIDMVVCRNVLIYFTPELQRRALQLFAYSLRDNGRLVLGQAETVSPLGEFFAPEEEHLKVFRRRGTRFLIPPALLTSPAPVPKDSSSAARRTTRNLQHTPELSRERQRASQIVENHLLGLPLGVVAVDRRYDIQTINNAARQLLSVHSAATGEDLIHLVHGEAAYTTLRSAIDHTFRERLPVNIDELSLEDPGSGEFRYLRLLIYPRREEGTQEPLEIATLFIVDITDLVQERIELTQQQERTNAELEGLRRESEAEVERQKDLNQRLEQANHRLTEGNKGLSLMNEELQVNNEELLLSAEEAQAATEEVETLNEELQATNEELETLNEELQATIEELNTTNDDLQARSAELNELAQDGEREKARLMSILSSIDNAVLVVNAEGQTVFQNAAYGEVFAGKALELEDEDGQPLPEDRAPWRRAVKGESFVTHFSATTQGNERRRFEATGAPFEGSIPQERGGIVVIREL